MGGSSFIPLQSTEVGVASFITECYDRGQLTSTISKSIQITLFGADTCSKLTSLGGSNVRTSGKQGYQAHDPP